jgi:DNA-binding transcriptional ArsR family regulator
MRILSLLRDRELAAGEIAQHFDVTRPAVSQHLRVLMEAGLLGERRVGTKRLYSIRLESLAEFRDFIDGFWETQLDNLKQTVEHDQRKERILEQQ